jgi:hypothetical protein
MEIRRRIQSAMSRKLKSSLDFFSDSLDSKLAELLLPPWQQQHRRLQLNAENSMFAQESITLLVSFGSFLRIFIVAVITCTNLF